MKKINSHNYEEYAIDYMMGNLPTNMAQEFSEFIAKHEDIANDILLFKTEDQDLSLQKKHKFIHLKKDINKLKITDSNFEEFCIASAESDLDEIANKQLEAYIGNDIHLKNEKESYSLLKLKKENILFPNKESLKHKEHFTLFTRHFWHLSTAISTAAILLFFWMSPLPNDSKKQVNDLAIINKTKEIVLQTEELNTETTLPDPIAIIPSKKINQHSEKVYSQKDKNVNLAIKEECNLHQATKSDLSTTLAQLKFLKHKRSKIDTQEKLTLQTLALVTPKEKNTLNKFSNSPENFKAKATNYIYSKVFTKSIESINKMAETSLGYQIIENTNGQVVSIKFSTQLGEINHIIAQR